MLFKLYWRDIISNDRLLVNDDDNADIEFAVLMTNNAYNSRVTNSATASPGTSNAKVSNPVKL